MSDIDSSSTEVRRPELRAGKLLAEGGEGRVYELVGRPGTLYKAYRRPAPREPVDGLISWLARLTVERPELAARVRASAAWPEAVVTEPGAPDGTAAGLLLPRAPRRFAVRHRDGTSRLATLSYLTADPGQRAAAYGLALPAAVSAERLGVVYALARLLEALQSADPAVGHGDLSTKNVLWSLERGPEVFLLDCDSCERFAAGGGPVDETRRRRAMTPNWDDPAIPSGADPTLMSDRYSLALIFLRVVGAAHFPLQRRQRDGEELNVDFGLPPAARRARALRDGAPVWGLCARSLSASEPEGRPPAAAWVAALEEILDDLGAMGQVRAVWSAQGGVAPAPTPACPDPAPDVRVRPVAASTSVRRWERVSPPVGRQAPSPLPSPVPRASTTPPPGPPPPGFFELGRQGVQKGSELWITAHRATVASLSTQGRRRQGAGRLAGCMVLDFALVAVVFYIVAMVASVLLGI